MPIAATDSPLAIADMQIKASSRNWGRITKIIFKKMGGLMGSQKITVFLSVLSMAVTGCATSPDKIPAQSVSTLPYEQYNCKQIAADSDRVNRRVGDLQSSLQKTASNDQAQMAVGMILFWPALFFLEGGDGPEAAEYGRLKGEREALEIVSIRKECGIIFQPIQQKPTADEKEAASSW